VTGHDVKNLRTALGWTTREFAKALGVSHMMVHRGEKGKPSRTLILLIERGLADGTLKLSNRKIKPE
jgi:transcriptional regulator with XRE-family HTH domain